MSELTLPDHAVKLDPTETGHGISTSGAHLRTCVGCRRSCRREELVRVVATGDGKVGFDLAGRAWGRGAWVHARTDCLAKCMRGLARALRRPITQSASELHQALAVAAWRQVGRLVAAARRGGHVMLGREAVEGACRECADVTLLLAQDTLAVAATPCLSQALSQGHVLILPSVTAMEEWLGTQDCVYAALTDSRITKAIAHMIAIAQTPAPARASRGSDTGTEVG